MQYAQVHNKMIFDKDNIKVQVYSIQRLLLNVNQMNAADRRRRFWHATHDCVAPYVDIILHRGRF